MLWRWIRVVYWKILVCKIPCLIFAYTETCAENDAGDCKERQREMGTESKPSLSVWNSSYVCRGNHLNRPFQRWSLIMNSSHQGVWFAEVLRAHSYKWSQQEMYFRNIKRCLMPNTEKLGLRDLKLSAQNEEMLLTSNCVPQLLIFKMNTKLLCLTRVL